MKRFSFIVDEKVKVWIRNYVNVEAETLEEAIQKCISRDCSAYDSEILYHTAERLSPDEEGEPTFEIYHRDKHSPVYTNDPTTRCL